jgi:putative membrane protein
MALGLLLRAGEPLAPGDLLRAWTWEPGVVAALLAAATWYAAGLRQLWRRAGRGRGVPSWRAAAFAGGIVALAVALLSPIDALGEALFSAHMVQHLMLIIIAAPLLVLGAPLHAMLWALPSPMRRRTARWWTGAPALRAATRALSAPVLVWGLHVATLWFWHLPGPYGWALRSEAVHALEHACFVGTAVLFWWIVIQPSGRRRMSYGAAVLYVAAAALQSGVLGALLTFSASPWYASHAASTRAWGLSALEDQQLAGLIMWVPMGVVYVVAAAVSFVLWLRTDQTDHVEVARAAA